MQAGAIFKGAGAELYEAVGEVDACQHGAILEGGEADVRYACGDRDLLQPRTIGKGRVGDAGNVRAERDGADIPIAADDPAVQIFQTVFALEDVAAAGKRILAQPDQAVRELDARKGSAAGKGGLPDPCEAVG